MTKSQIETVVGGLVEIIESWNDTDGEDRGRRNDAICLTLFDDGSGLLGRRRCFEMNHVEDWHDFKNLDELAELFRDQGLEVEE